MISRVVLFALALALALPFAAVPARAAGPEIVTDDVDRFYALYDATGGKPSIEQIQRDYLDKASPGLAAFAKLRGITADRIANALTDKPKMFADARQCAASLPAVRRRLRTALSRLGELYPRAVFPPVTIIVGRGRTGGMANRSLVAIGLETICSYDFMGLGVEDRFVHMIAHEYVHVQQTAAQVEDPADTVLKASIIEGVAEFIGELISGSVFYTHLHRSTKGQEAQLETAFLADIDKTAIGSRWLYDGAQPIEQRDLGYWVGYRIAKAYYRRANDERAAVAQMIEMADPKAFLGSSGWSPGMKLEGVH